MSGGLEGGLCRRSRVRGADDGHLELLPGVVLLDFGDGHPYISLTSIFKAMGQ